MTKQIKRNEASGSYLRSSRGTHPERAQRVEGLPLRKPFDASYGLAQGEGSKNFPTPQRNIFLLLPLCFILCVSLFAASAWALPKAAKMDEKQIELRRYEAAIKESLKRAEKLGRRSQDPSLPQTVTAGRFLFSKQSGIEAVEEAKNAAALNPENPLAVLIYADSLSVQGNYSEADSGYRQFLFLLENPGPGHLRDRLFKINDIRPILTHVSTQLKAHGGQPFDAKAFDNRLFRNNFSIQFKWFLENLIPYGLVVVILLGIPFFLFRRLTDTEASIPTERMLMQIYAVLIVGFAIWMAHTFGKLPVLFEPMELEILALIAAGTVFAIGFRIGIHIKKYQAVLSDPNMRECPKCKKIILKLATACPFCKQKIE